MSDSEQTIDETITDVISADETSTDETNTEVVEAETAEVTDDDGDDDGDGDETTGEGGEKKKRRPKKHAPGGPHADRERPAFSIGEEDAVFLTGLHEGSMPLGRAAKSTDDLEEEYRSAEDGVALASTTRSVGFDLPLGRSLAKLGESAGDEVGGACRDCGDDVHVSSFLR